MPKDKPQVTYVRLIAFILLGAVAYVFSSLFIILLLAFLLTVIFVPLVRKADSWHVPRALSAIIVGILLVVVPVASIGLLALPLADQVSAFVQDFPALIETLSNVAGVSLSQQEITQQLQQWAEGMGGKVVAVSLSAAGVVSGMVLVVVLTIYWLIYYEKIMAGITSFFAQEKRLRNRYNLALQRIETRLGTWAKGQVILSVTIGTLVWLIFSIIGLPYAPVLGVIAGLMEFIPNIGPFLGAVPAFIVALTVSPTMFLMTVGGYVLVQTAESYLLAPKIISGSAKFNPFVILVLILTGGYVMGVIGALLAVPFAIIVTEIYRARQAAPA